MNKPANEFDNIPVVDAVPTHGAHSAPRRVSEGSTLITATGSLVPPTLSGTLNTPKQVKGGAFAPADIKLIKRALEHYSDLDISDGEHRQIANLLHRLNNRV